MKQQFPDDELWHGDMVYAFEQAACAIESEEYGGAETQLEYDRQQAANQEVARLIREMGERYLKRKQRSAK